jgi:hypothetical protein
MCFNLNIFNLCISASNNNTNKTNNCSDNNNSEKSSKVKSKPKTDKRKGSASKTPTNIITNNNSTISITTNLIATTNSDIKNDTILKTRSVALDLSSALCLDNGLIVEKEQISQEHILLDESHLGLKSDNDNVHTEKVIKHSDSTLDDKYFANYWNYSNLSYSELHNITIDEFLNTKDHTHLLATSSLSTFSSLSPSLLSNSSSAASARESTKSVKFIKMNTDKIENTPQPRPKFNIPFSQNGSFLNMNSNANANGFSSISPISPSRPTISLSGNANNSSLTGLNRPFINLTSNAPKTSPFELKMSNLSFKKQAYTFTSDQLLPKSNDEELSYILDENLNNLRLDDNNNLNSSSNTGCNSTTKNLYEKKSQSGKHHSHHHHHDKPKSAGGKIRISANQVIYLNSSFSPILNNF